MDYKRRALKKELMRDMINVIIASIYRDGSKPYFPCINYTVKQGNLYKEIETDKCRYVMSLRQTYSDTMYYEKIYDVEGNRYTCAYVKERDIMSVDTDLCIRHKTEGQIRPTKNSDLERRMLDMFKEIFTYV